MIKDLEAYRRLCEKEHWDALRRARAEDSIAVGEALLSSDLMRIAVFADDDHPRSFARALGIDPERASR